MKQETQPKLLFPWKLHQLLDESEEKGFSNIISWTKEGKSFRVHSKDAFTSTVMPLYFETAKYKSFQRSLNLWGFRTETRGTAKGDCSHPLFLRGQPNLCTNMERVRVRGLFSRTKDHKKLDPQEEGSLNKNSGPSMIHTPILPTATDKLAQNSHAMLLHSLISRPVQPAHRALNDTLASLHMPPANALLASQLYSPQLILSMVAQAREALLKQLVQQESGALLL